MATGNVAWTATHAEASEPEDKESSGASGPDTEPNQSFRKWITTLPGTMTDWISYIEVLQEEVREGSFFLWTFRMCMHTVHQFPEGVVQG